MADNNSNIPAPPPGYSADQIVPASQSQPGNTGGPGTGNSAPPPPPGYSADQVVSASPQTQPKPAPQTQPAQQEEPGFLSRTWETVGGKGIGNLLSAEASHRVDALHKAYDMIKQGDYKSATAYAMVASTGATKDDPIYQAARQIVTMPIEEIKAGREALWEGKEGKDTASRVGGAVKHGLSAIPLLGPAARGIGEAASEDLHLGDDKPVNIPGLLGDIAGGAIGIFGPKALADTKAARAARVAGKVADVKPEYVYRARDVGESGIPATGAHAQATYSMDEANSYAQSRGKVTGKPQEVVRVDLNKVPKDSYNSVQRQGGADWVKFDKDVPEQHIEPVTPSPASMEQAAPLDSGSAKARGEAVQDGIEKSRAAKGEATDTATKQAEAALTTDKLPIRPNGAAAILAQKVLKDEPVSDSLKPIFEKWANPIQAAEDEKPSGLVDEQGKPLASTSGPKAGEPRTMSSQDLRQELTDLQNQIDSMQSGVDAGRNGRAIGQLKRLRGAINQNRYDLYEEFGDAQKAQAARSLSTQYANMISDIREGPAAVLLKSKSPEQVMSKIVSSGRRSQSAVETIVKYLGAKDRAYFADDLLNTIYDESGKGDGLTDAAAVARKFRKMGDTATTVFGADRTARLQKLYDSAEQMQLADKAEQVAKQEHKANLVKAGTSAVLGGAGAMFGPFTGLAGVAAGPVVGEGLRRIFNIGKAGQLRVGIGPDQIIVLSPDEMRMPDNIDKVTDFVNAIKTGVPEKIDQAYRGVLGATGKGLKAGQAGMVIGGAQRAEDKRRKVYQGASSLQ